MRAKDKITKGLKTLDDLRAAHDKDVIIPNLIRAAIQRLVDSGDAWAYEADFMKLVNPGISTTDISRFRDQFEAHWAAMPSTNGKSSMRRVWFASKKAAAEWKAK